MESFSGKRSSRENLKKNPSALEKKLIRELPYSGLRRED